MMQPPRKIPMAACALMVSSMVGLDVRHATIQGGRGHALQLVLAVSFLIPADVRVSKFGENFESTFVLRHGEGMQLPCDEF